MNDKLAIFENFKIRRHYDEKMETWFFSVVDIVQALIQQPESVRATGMEENKSAGKKGGGIAKKARLELEAKTGSSVVTQGNYLPPKRIRR